MSNSPIVIAGSGRSGTTWVLDVIAEANQLKTLFEPLHPIAVNKAHKFSNCYIRKDSKQTELKEFMDKVFNGSLNSIWINYRVRKDRLKPTVMTFMSLNEAYIFYLRYKKLLRHIRIYRSSDTKGVIVKFIRANLMLGWLKSQYNLKILYIVRHPGAVVESKIRKGKNDWDHRQLLETYINDKDLKDDFLDDYWTVISNAKSKIACHTLIWCIENGIPLKEAKKNGYHTVFYENLIANSHYEWNRIVKYLGLEKKPDAKILQFPSQQTSFEKKNILFNSQHLTKWMKNFRRVELEEINHILQAFDIDVYDAFDPMPCI